MVKQGPETTGNKGSEPLNKCPVLGNKGHLEAREHRALHGTQWASEESTFLHKELAPQV